MPRLSASSAAARRAPLGAALAAMILSGCGEPAPGRTYYERQVEPILQQFCSGNTAGCHVINDDDPFAFASGNLDVSSFESVQKRRDLLQASGVYPVPPLLIKAVGQGGGLQIGYGGAFYDLEVAHAGGNILQVGSQAYLTLLEWMENGATENGLPPQAPRQAGRGACSTFVPVDFDPEPYTTNASFRDFVSAVQPVLAGCSAASCHGAQQSDFYVTCGEDETQQAFNFSQAQAFIATPVASSPILQVPLAVAAGGHYHSGGAHFSSRNDADYTAVYRWAEQVGGVEFGDGDPARIFFARHVQPKLLTLGCSLGACHSPGATNDLKLRSGSQGFFSAIALERNYQLLRNDFMALEVPDARRGRAVAKTILQGAGGIAHRGGPVLAASGGGLASPASCPQPFDPDTASAFCAFQEWMNIERQVLIAADQVLPLGAQDTVPIVYVQRAATHVASPLEFDTYQPGSDLMVVDATLDAQGSIVAVGAPRSLLDECPDATDRGAIDVRSPDVRHDGVTVAFAMRTGAAEPLSIYTVDISGADCARLTPAQPDRNGIKLHDFDPAWSPDGEHIVFASTRGGAGGPTLSRRYFLPQSDIWRMTRSGANPERVTFLTNSELSPQMMREGRIIMTTEKISAGFYQLAGRRINWDLTDYHPLLAQRAESPFADPADPTATLPSVAYAQATELREGFDGNFVLVLSDPGLRGGAGTIAIFNRSVGTFEEGRNDPGFLKSMLIPDRAATGRAGATSGAYRSPFPLPDGQILVSYADFSGDLATATALDWNLVALHSRTGARTPILTGAGAQVEAVLALKHPPRKPYYNRRQIVFGGEQDAQLTGGAEWAIFHVPDVPMIFTLLNANLRRGRPVELFRGAAYLAVFEERPAPPGTTSGTGEGGIFEQRELLGTARLARDGSVRLRLPAGKGVILQLRGEQGNVLQTMWEEHQLGPGEVISFGIRQELFDAGCGGCHGSVSGRETDVVITPDVLTSASVSLSADDAPASLSR